MSDVNAFAATFQQFMAKMAESAPPAKRPANVFLEELKGLFGADPRALSVLAHTFPEYEHPNIQVAMDEIAQGRPGVKTMGFTAEQYQRYAGISLSDLIASDYHRQFKAGPVEYQDFVRADGSVIACMRHGIVLMPGDPPVAVLISTKSQMSEPAVEVQVMAPKRTDAEAFLQQLRSRASVSSVYRGHSLTVNSGYHGVRVAFHPLPRISREDIILNEDTLARIERQTVSFADVAEKLRAARRHLKRGVLLHGPPGTGKTLTAMYLASRMAGRAVLLTAGLGMGTLREICRFARALQPSTVVLEDVDLIAEERDTSGDCSTPLLFELLNQMDGLNEDADVLFILTTNRPEALEKALSARPGRVDQAIEVPLPDAACRKRLIELYARGIELRLGNMDGLVERISGCSASFVRELIRRATLLAILDGEGSAVGDKQVEEALRELTLSGALTGKLLGYQGDEEG